MVQILTSWPKNRIINQEYSDMAQSVRELAEKIKGTNNPHEALKAAKELRARAERRLHRDQKAR